MADIPSEPYAHLAIESTGRSSSLAILRGESVLWHWQHDGSSRTAATLAPQLKNALQWCKNHSESLDFVSVAVGPGSFTGLRIGVTTAKTLCYGLGLRLVAIDSLAAIAAATFLPHATADKLLVGVNAYRGQVFKAEFQRQSLLPPIDGPLTQDAIAWWNHVHGSQILDQQQWVALRDQRPRGLFIAGDPTAFDSSSEHLLARTCDAVGVGLLGIRAAISGHWTDPLALVPNYLKPSAAEEKAAMGKP